MAKQIILILFLLTFGLFFLLKKKAESTSYEDGKKIESLPYSVMDAPADISSQAKFVTSNATLGPVLSSLKHVDEMSQTELQDLYQDMEAMINSHPDETLAEIRRELSHSLKLPLENGFFLASSWIRYAPNPTSIIFAIWDKKLVQTKNNLDDTHHSVLNENEKLERMKSYVLFELRKRNRVSALNEGSEFLSKLSHLAATEKSYDISIEAFQLLQELKRDDLVKNALTKRTKVEQKFLAGVIELHGSISDH
jgi:hypothetical protein